MLLTLSCCQTVTVRNRKNKCRQLDGREEEQSEEEVRHDKDEDELVKEGPKNSAEDESSPELSKTNRSENSPHPNIL